MMCAARLKVLQHMRYRRVTEGPGTVLQHVDPAVVTVDEPEAEGEYRREMAEDIRAQQALRRRGLPEEQAAAIAFLASDDASFITGQVINCSGGQS